MLELPKPPSVNNIYRYTSRGGFASSYISKEGKDWFLESGKILKKNQSRRKKSITGQLEVWIELYTNRKHQDVDNIAKPTLDLLGNFCMNCLTKYSSRKKCKCGENFSLFADDDQVYSLHINKNIVKKDEQKITVEWFVLVN